MVKNLPYILLLIILFVGNSQNTFSQNVDVENSSNFDKGKKLYRFYAEGVAFTGIEVTPNHYTNVANAGKYSYFVSGGLQAKIGNNWYLQKGKFTGILRLTWARLGLYLQGAILSPLHIGLGHHFHISDNFSIQTYISGGAVIGTSGTVNSTWVFTYGAFFELKFIFNKFTIGLEYTARPTNKELFSSNDGYFHYIGLTIGGVFKKVKVKN